MHGKLTEVRAATRNLTEVDGRSVDAQEVHGGHADALIVDEILTGYMCIHGTFREFPSTFSACTGPIDVSGASRGYSVK